MYIYGTNRIIMRFMLSIALCLATGYRPVYAAISDDLVEDTGPVPYNNTYTQTDANTADSKIETLPQASRGRMLHENHCTSCHESMAYIRAKRKAKNYEAVRYWVNQRANWLKLGWTGLEKQEVIQYLNERYYKYPIPK